MEEDAEAEDSRQITTARQIEVCFSAVRGVKVSSQNCFLAICGKDRLQHRREF